MTATSSVEILQDLIKNPPQGKKDEAVAARSLLNEYEACNQNEVTLLNIHALSLFVQDFDREELFRHISNRPWIEKHEILTRWAWMTSQKEEIQNKKTFSHPYLCKVGCREGRKTLDREFDTFLFFFKVHDKK